MFAAQIFVTYLAFVLCTKGVYTEHDLQPRWVNPNDGHSFWGSHRPTAKINPMVKKVEQLQTQVDHLEKSILELTLITANLLKKVKELEIRKPVCIVCAADKMKEFPLNPSLLDLTKPLTSSDLPPLPPSLTYPSKLFDFPPDPTLFELTTTRTMSRLPPIPPSWIQPSLADFPPNPKIYDLTTRRSLADLPPIPESLLEPSPWDDFPPNPTLEELRKPPTFLSLPPIPPSLLPVDLIDFPPDPTIYDLTTKSSLASLPPMPASLKDPPPLPGFPPNPTVEGLTTPATLLGLPPISKHLLDFPPVFPPNPTLRDLTTVRTLAGLPPIPTSLIEPPPSSGFPSNPTLDDLTTPHTLEDYPPMPTLVDWPPLSDIPQYPKLDKWKSPSDFPPNPALDNSPRMPTSINWPSEPMIVLPISSWLKPSQSSGSPPNPTSIAWPSEPMIVMPASSPWLKSPPSTDWSKMIDGGSENIAVLDCSEAKSALSYFPSQLPQLPNSCASALQNGEPDGVYLIEIKPSFRFYAYCLNDAQHNGQAWTLVQRRIDGTINFNRNWKDFKVGFGHLQGEFFLGMDILHEITMSEPQEIRMELGDWTNTITSIAYDSFAIGNEYDKYRIQVLGNYSGDVDYLRGSAGERFSTYDLTEDNDSDENRHCAVLFNAAWWHSTCNDTTQWTNQEIINTIDCPPSYHGSGFGRTYTENANSLKTALVAVRPRQFN